jgi:hypothetical protein
MNNLGLDAVVQRTLAEQFTKIEDGLDRDTIAIYGQIVSGLDQQVRDAIEAIPRKRRKKAAIVLDTPGGSVEVVERMVGTLRHFYDDLMFIVPDMAMSAGTIFCMAGDSIWMDYFSRLGPIDPQVFKDGRWVPALSYLVQLDRLLAKDREGTLTNAEYGMLARLDLAELHQYEQARALSITLLKNWLTLYKFKSWKRTNSRGLEVTQRMRTERAERIATTLSDNTLWHSHGRGISRDTLIAEPIQLQIDDLASKQEVYRFVREYHHCLSDFIRALKLPTFVQSSGFPR